MTFCEGELAMFERMMKTVPGFDKRLPKEKEKGCKFCACYDGEKKCCNYDKCPFFS